MNSLIADRTELWWTSNRPDQAGLWESKIELSEKFFQEIIRHPVPIDINTLTALKRSTLGLDLYLWLVYRTFARAGRVTRVYEGKGGTTAGISWEPAGCTAKRYCSSGEHTRTTPMTGNPRSKPRSCIQPVLRELGPKWIKLAWPRAFELHHGLRAS